MKSRNLGIVALALLICLPSPAATKSVCIKLKADLDLKTPFITQPIALQDGTIVVGRQNEMDYWFVGPDAALKGRYATNARVTSPAMQLRDGTVVIGGNKDGNLHLLDAEGNFKSILPVTSNEYLGTPAELDDGTLVTFSHSGIVYFLRRSGEILSSYNAGQWITAQPLVLKDQSVVVKSHSVKNPEENDGGYLFFFRPDGSLRMGGIPTGRWGWQIPIELRDGSVLSGGYFGSGEELTSKIVRIHSTSGKVISETTIDKGESFTFARLLSNGKLAIGISRLYLPDGTWGTSLKLKIENADGTIFGEFIAKGTGYAATWNIAETQDGALVLPAGERIFFLTLEATGISSAEFLPAKETFFESAPQVLPDGAVVVSGRNYNADGSSGNGRLHILAQVACQK